MATISRPRTFEEFEKLPDNGRRRDLRHADIVEMPPPVHGHKMIERRLRRILDQAAGSAGAVEIEAGFKLGEQDYRIADMAFVSPKVWDSLAVESIFEGCA